MTSQAITVGQGQGANSNAASASAATPMVPFAQASHRGCEPGPVFQLTPGASSIPLGPVGLPANGFLRMLEIDVQTITAGSGGSPVLAPDSPAGILQSVRLQDTNGNQIDQLGGYSLLVDNIFGAYAGAPDPRRDPDYSSNPLSPSIQLQVVRELAPNGFGSLANMSSSQQFKLSLTVAPASVIWTTPPTNIPTLQISTWMHYWQLPAAVDPWGRPQEQVPPFLGTTQYRWFSPANPVTQQWNLPVNQVGNQIRYIALIARNNSGVRDNGVFPDPLQLRWNNDFLFVIGQRQIRKMLTEFLAGLTVLDAGVIVLPFNYGTGRFLGGSGINSWLPTSTGTRLDLIGTQPSSDPGLVDVLVDDVSVGEVNPSLRPVSPNAGSFSAPTAAQLVTPAS